MARFARLLLALVAGCGGAQNTPSEIQTVGSPGLGAGDVFEIRVLGEEDLTAQYRVESDGTIDFPFLGRVEVAGLDSRHIAAAIRDGLMESDILVDPQVTVFVSEANSLRVTVMGAVAQPGTFPVTPGMTAAQAVSMAGGFTALASQNDSVLTRRENGELRRFELPMRRISRGQESDVTLQGGDILYVPERVF